MIGCSKIFLFKYKMFTAINKILICSRAKITEKNIGCRKIFLFKFLRILLRNYEHLRVLELTTCCLNCISAGKNTKVGSKLQKKILYINPYHAAPGKFRAI